VLNVKDLRGQIRQLGIIKPPFSRQLTHGIPAAAGDAVCFWSIMPDHPGTVTLDERGCAFAGPGFTGSFENGILAGILLKRTV